MIDTLFVIILAVIVGTWVTKAIADEEPEKAIPAIIFGFIMLFFALPISTNIMEGISEGNVSFPIRSFPEIKECVKEGWIDCEEENIPLEECEKEVTIEGPYWNETEVIKYKKWGCVEYGG